MGPQHARRSHRARGSGFTSDLWRNSSDLCERHREVLLRHALDMIMLRCPASAVAAARQAADRWTVSLGIRQIRGPDRPDLGTRCTAGDRHGPCDTGVNGPPMARGAVCGA